MNLYDEFFAIVAVLNQCRIRYAVVGGIALAFHGRPRFTRDVDFLVHQKDLDVLKMALERLDYEETAEPWMLPDTPLVRHRFLKVEGQDEIMIDIFLTSDDEHLRIIEDAVPAESEVGPVPVAARRDIIWMKRSRNSDQDRVDISELEENDEN